MQPTVDHSIFRLERSYPVPPARVSSAFADAATKRRWFVEGDHHTVDSHTLDLSPGGREIAQIRFAPGTPVAGMTCVNETNYHVVVRDRLLVFSSTMSLENHPISSALVTIELLPTASGTDLLLTHQGAFFEGSDGPERREQGWKTLFERLPAQLGA